MNAELRNGVPKDVDVRLEAWAQWARKLAEGMGWPYQTLLARLIEYGPHGTAGGSRPPVEMPEAVAEIDRIIAKMPRKLADVLRTHYLTWAPQDVKARNCHISVSKFRYRLESAQWFVYARLQS